MNASLIPNIFLTIIILLTGGALSSLVMVRNQRIANQLSHAFASVASIFGVILAGLVLYGGQPIALLLGQNNLLIPLQITIDMVGAWFILAISLVTLASSLYGFSYMDHFRKEYSLSSFGFFYNLFILSLYLVVATSNAVSFLFVWEIMSLASLFLVLFEHKRADVVSAGKLYVIMTHAGTACILFAFLLLFKFTGSFDYATIALRVRDVPQAFQHIIFLLALVGFGTKAGIIPLHIWLPKAHSSAPSHVSALMSGVMIKMGVLMIVRFMFTFLPTHPLWWGIVILLIGASSSLLGVMYALTEHDIKRLLAYHSIENIGIILLGLGSAMMFGTLNMPAFQTIAIVASLFHTINHALFKSLLFLGAGSVIMQTHTRDIEEYGGLLKRMPYTGLFFLIGAMAISALPPLNGFASEWLTYQGLIAGVAVSSMTIKAVFITGIIFLAFTGGLAAMCFVKAFGIAFLARPRSTEAEHAHESPMPMVVAMGLLSAICIGLGLGAQPVQQLLHTITNTMLVASTDTVVMTTFVRINPLVVFGVLVGVGGVVYLLSTRVIKTTTRKDITWNCGFSYVTPRMEITSTGFARSIILIFRGLLRPSRQTSVEYIDANSNNPYFVKSKTFQHAIENIYERFMYQPIDTVMTFCSKRVKAVQTGYINHYLLYIFVTLIVVLIWARYIYTP